MNKQQFDKLYFGKAIQCDTEEKANDFLALAKSVGYQWASGADLEIKNYWDRFRENTVYHIDIYGPYVYYEGVYHINAGIQSIIKYGEGSTLGESDGENV